MALLTAEQRKTAGREYQQTRDRSTGGTAWSKAERIAVVGAVDDWISANAASLRADVNAAGGSGLTNAQVAELLAHVVKRRFMEGA